MRKLECGARRKAPRLLLLALLLHGCAVPPAPRTWLDERTAATVTVQSAPAVLAREEQMRAINVRDYAQLGAVEVNRMGERELYLVIVFWSTIDRSKAEHEQRVAAFARIGLQIDDRTLELQRIPDDAAPAGLGSPPFQHPAPQAHDSYYKIARSDLRALALSRRLELTTRGPAEEPSRYLEWRDGRPGLTLFLARLPQSR